MNNKNVYDESIIDPTPYKQFFKDADGNVLIGIGDNVLVKNPRTKKHMKFEKGCVIDIKNDFFVIETFDKPIRKIKISF